MSTPYFLYHFLFFFFLFSSYSNSSSFVFSDLETCLCAALTCECLLRDQWSLSFTHLFQVDCESLTWKVTCDSILQLKVIDCKESFQKWKINRTHKTKGAQTFFLPVYEAKFVNVTPVNRTAGWMFCMCEINCSINETFINHGKNILNHLSLASARETPSLL